MVTNRFSLLFRLKKPNNYLKGNMPVYMRITIDSVRSELSVNRDFDPHMESNTNFKSSGDDEFKPGKETIKKKIMKVSNVDGDKKIKFDNSEFIKSFQTN